MISNFFVNLIGNLDLYALQIPLLVSLQTKANASLKSKASIVSISFINTSEDVWKVKKSSSNGNLSVDKNATALQEPCLNHIQVT